MTRRYTAEQLQQLFQQIAGESFGMPRSSDQPAGPSINVYLRRSELFPNEDVQTQYWQLLQDVPVVNALGVLASINRILTQSERDVASHRALNEQFLEPAVAEQVARSTLRGRALSVVFHRL